MIRSIPPHPNIISFHDAFTYQDEKGQNWYALVMDYAFGGTLDDLIRQSKEDNKFNIKHVKKWIKQILNGICHLHTHDIIHRDLKPQNILVDSVGDIRIADFGCSKLLSKDQRSTKTLVGTPHYMAPEIKHDNAKYDFCADMWSIGVLIYYICQGSVTYNNQTLYNQLRKGIKPQLSSQFQCFQDLVDNLLVIDVDQRAIIFEAISIVVVALNTQIVLSFETVD